MDYIINELHINAKAEKEYVSALAPVVIFAYNRKIHLEQTLNSLSNNLYAKNTDVYVFSDGAGEKQNQEIQEVRTFLHSYDPSVFKNLYIIERSENWGLGKNIINGVTDIVKKYKKVIVLEDDVITSRYYLQYMNDALILYRNHERVMEIAGFIPRFVDFHSENNAFFLKWPISWGWGTWERSWDRFERNPEKLINTVSKEDIYTININGIEKEQWNQVLRNYNGEIYTWGIFWSVSIIRNNGVVLYSGKNMCKNIGFDGSGVNSGSINIDDFPNNDIVNTPVIGFPSVIEIDAQDEMNYIKSIKKRNLTRKMVFYKSIPKRLIRKIIGRS